MESAPITTSSAHGADAGDNSGSSSPSVEETHAPALLDNKEVLALRTEMLELQEKRTRVEEEVKQALEFLASTPVGMHGALIDNEGFPRSDCDLYAVRRARQTVNCGQNDLKDIEVQLYEKLGTLHDSTKEEARMQQLQDAESHRKRQQQAEQRQKRLAEVQAMNKLRPFLNIAGVQPASPAFEGGLRSGMLIVQYGGLNVENVNERGVPIMQAMAEITSKGESQVLSVWVREQPEGSDEDARELFVVPQRWAGAGLLGCAFDPVA